MAELTQHVPDTGQHLTRRYGWHSNTMRGCRAGRARELDAHQQHEAHQQHAPIVPQQEPPIARLVRQRWAQLIKRVYEVDPMRCPRCDGHMKIVSFIEPRQRDVIDAIIRHCSLDDDTDHPGPRAPPQPTVTGEDS